MPELMQGKKNIYFSMSADNGLGNWIPMWIEDLRKIPVQELRFQKI